MICERCNAPDGRHVDEYKLKGGITRVFCDPCARLTAAVHDMTPTPPPEAPEAEAAAEEPTEEAQEAEPEAETEGQEPEAKPTSRRQRGN